MAVMVFDHPSRVPLAWATFLTLLVSPWLTAMLAVRWMLAAQHVARHWACAAAAAGAAAVRSLAFGLSAITRAFGHDASTAHTFWVVASAVWATPWLWLGACAARFAWRRWQA